MPRPPPQDESPSCQRNEKEHPEMFSYSNPQLVDAEVNYRRERLGHDWLVRTALDTAPDTAPSLRRIRSSVAVLAHLRPTSRHHRHA
jgi:hypothetical protein